MIPKTLIFYIPVAAFGESLRCDGGGDEVRNVLCGGLVILEAGLDLYKIILVQVLDLDSIPSVYKSISKSPKSNLYI